MELVSQICGFSIQSVFSFFMLISAFEGLRVTLTDYKGGLLMEQLGILKEWKCWKKK